MSPRVLGFGLACAAGFAAYLLHGCAFDTADDCALNPILGCGPYANGSTTTSSSSSSSTSSSSGQANCDPVMGAVADACGVFVSPTGNDGNAGTQEAPLATLTAALGKGSTIYACAGATPYSEAVVVGKAATLYGALDCSGWAYDASKKTQLTATAGAIPLMLAGGASGVVVLDFAVTAVDAPTGTPGGSSIAVVVNQATATFERCALVAGKASDGAAGASGGTQAAVANGGTAGDAAGLTGTENGGSGGTNAACGLAGRQRGARWPAPQRERCRRAARRHRSGRTQGHGRHRERLHRRW